MLASISTEPVKSLVGTQFEHTVSVTTDDWLCKTFFASTHLLDSETKN